MTGTNTPNGSFDDVRQAGVIGVATAFGLTHVQMGRSLAPCPICNVERRGSGDRRGPLGITPDGGGWICFRCNAKGDAVALAAACVTGDAHPARGAWGVILRECEVRGLCRSRPSSGRGFSGPASRPPSPAMWWSSARDSVVASPPDPPRYPPVCEVLEVWSACVPVVDDPDVLALLQKRGLDPEIVAQLDLARALPVGKRVPRWASKRMHEGERPKPWNDAGYRLLTGLRSADGQMQSIRARSVIGSKPKSVAPAAGPGSTVGLVLANAGARFVLETGSAPPSWNESVPLRIVITEGEPDFLVWSTMFFDRLEAPPPVFGIFSGSWTSNIAARVPDGAVIIIRNHPDAKGEQYAAKIARTLAGRCTVRWKPVKGGTR